MSTTVYGHTQDGHPFAVDTLIDVDDDVLGLHEPMWVMERTYTKSRSAGTTTTLTLIRRYTLDLSA
jgi:prophage tail gpP-like protein